jgi:hypothetical protein
MNAKRILKAASVLACSSAREVEIWELTITIDGYEKRYPVPGSMEMFLEEEKKLICEGGMFDVKVGEWMKTLQEPLICQCQGYHHHHYHHHHYQRCQPTSSFCACGCAAPSFMARIKAWMESASEHAIIAKLFFAVWKLTERGNDIVGESAKGQLREAECFLPVVDGLCESCTVEVNKKAGAIWREFLEVLSAVSY